MSSAATQRAPRLSRFIRDNVEPILADGRRGATAAQAHGSGRAGSGFTIGQMVAEFRALRASVTRLWSAQEPGVAATIWTI